MCVLNDDALAVDLTMQAGMEPRSLESQSPPGELAQGGEEDSNIRDEERAFARRERPSSISLRSAFRNSDDTNVEETELRTRASSDRKSTRLNSSHSGESRMPSSA